MGVLLVIIALDVVVMILVMRTVWTEPPRKHPSPHPFALEYASKSETEPEAKVVKATQVENGDETLPIAEETNTETAGSDSADE